MRLRTKAMLFVIVTVAALFGLMIVGARAVVLGSFDRIEGRAAATTDADAAKIVATLADEFVERGTDWSDWDDLAQYAADGNQEFRDGNLTADGLGSVNWDHLLIIRGDGTLVYGQRWVRADNTLTAPAPELLALVADGALAPADDWDQSRGGFALIGGELHMVASRGVHMTDHRRGTVAARLITTRVVDEAWMARLRRFTFLEIAFQLVAAPAPDPAAATARAALLAGVPRHTVATDQAHTTYSVLRDVRGAPLLVMRVTQPRTLRAAGQSMLGAISKGLIACAIVLALFAAVALGRGVVRPVLRLLDGVGRLEGGARVKVDVTSEDELGQLAAGFNRMADAIVDREAALRLVLDSTGDGLVLVDLSGTPQGRCSAPARAWFGETTAGPIWDWLPFDARTRAGFELGFMQLASDILPFEVAVDQMPKAMPVGDATYRFDYKPVHADGALVSILVVVRDATAAVAAEHAERHTRELQAVVGHAFRDRGAFAAFLEEGEALAAALRTPQPLVDAKRTLHTLKGNAAIFGLETVAEMAHHGEDRIADDPAEAATACVAAADAWAAARHRIDAVLGKDADGRIQLDAVEYEDFLRALVVRDQRDLADQVRRWRNLPTRDILERLARQVDRLARQVGKAVDVRVVGGAGQRLPRGDLGPLFASLVHVVRNAVDHGIESEADRLAKGKPARGTVVLAVDQHAEHLRIEIQDDGGGIAWARVAERAAAMGLDVADLSAALFADGLTTRDEVSELSGRGVGLAAARRAVTDVGGEVTVTSSDRGTAFRFTLPITAATARVRAA